MSGAPAAAAAGVVVAAAQPPLAAVLMMLGAAATLAVSVLTTKTGRERIAPTVVVSVLHAGEDVRNLSINLNHMRSVLHARFGIFKKKFS